MAREVIKRLLGRVKLRCTVQYYLSLVLILLFQNLGAQPGFSGIDEGLFLNCEDSPLSVVKGQVEFDSCPTEISRSLGFLYAGRLTQCRNQLAQIDSAIVAEHQVLTDFIWTVLHNKQGAPDSAYVHAKKALAFCEEHEFSSDLEVRLRVSHSESLMNLGVPDSALNQLHSALSSAAQNDCLLSLVYLQLARYYDKTGRQSGTDTTHEVDSCASLSEKYASRCSSVRLRRKILFNKAAYFQMNGNRDSAMMYYDQSQRVNLSIDDWNFSTRLWLNKGSHYKNWAKKYDDQTLADSLRYLGLQALDSADHYYGLTGSNSGLARSRLNRSFLARDLGRPEQRMQFLHESLKLAPASELKLKDDIYYSISSAYMDQGNIDSALVYYRNGYNNLYDLVGKTKAQAIARQRVLFETSQKEKVIAQQRATNLQTENDLLQTRQTLWIGGAIGLFFIGLFFIGFQVQRNKRKTAQIEAAAAEEKADRKVGDLMQKHRYDKLVATIQGEEKERDRLAKEVHDGVGGTISGIAMQLESEEVLSDEEKIKTLAASLRTAHDDLRNIAHNLSIPSIENNTLVELVTNLLNNVQASHDIKVSLVVFPSDKPLELESQLEIMLYRIAQEAINNVLKHAGASTLDIQITKHESAIQMIVEDDGSGFEGSTDGIGLRNMQERAEALNGKFKVDSRPERGTIITVEVPLS